MEQVEQVKLEQVRRPQERLSAGVAARGSEQLLCNIKCTRTHTHTHKCAGDTPSIGCHFACGSCKLICHDLQIEMDL